MTLTACISTIPNKGIMVTLLLSYIRLLLVNDNVLSSRLRA